jgi:hypothetical protein
MSPPILGKMGLKAIDTGTGAEGACDTGRAVTTAGVLWVPVVTNGGTKGLSMGAGT